MYQPAKAAGDEPPRLRLLSDEDTLPSPDGWGGILWLSPVVKMAIVPLLGLLGLTALPILGGRCDHLSVLLWRWFGRLAAVCG